MQNIFIIFFLVLIIFQSGCSDAQNPEKENIYFVEIPDSLSLYEKLKMLPGVEVEKIRYDSLQYKGGYKLMFSQPLDYEHPEKGSFKQKAYLTHINDSLPMVAYLDGYCVPNNRFRSEIADFLNANYIQIEHRYFCESAPDSIDWQYLTVRQSAWDHHKIIQLLKNIYKDKWISTGISKGGQTVIYHKRFFPEDVDVAVPVVAPLNLEENDPRIYEFLKNAGTKECREKVRDVQIYLLKNRSKTFPVFKDKVEKYGYKYKHNLDTIFELSVFELEFAFWQWIGNCNFLPDKIKSANEAVDLLFRYDACGFFENKMVNELFPFFYQSYTETGMYGYKTEPFKDYLVAYKNDVNNMETFIPRSFNLEYNKNAMLDINQWLKDSGNNMIYIYGELDAWSSTAVDPGNKTNALKIIKKGGTHQTRISNLPADQKELVLSTLEKWLNRKIYRD
ncbi:MAG: S28 family serine protease [Bacteroidota bacterium]